MQDLRTSERLDVLDGLRGIAVLLVVWYHLWLVSGFVLPMLGASQLFVESGYLGVDLFFFISGFCIALPYARAQAAGRPLPATREFARRRALKIVPSYLLALSVFSGLNAWKFSGFGDWFASMAAHLAFVHVWFPQTFGSISGPLWTIGVEVQFYALFALVAGVAVRYPLRAFFAFAAIAQLYRWVLAWNGLDADFGWINQLPAVLDLFGAGIFAACAYCTVTRIRAGWALDRRSRPLAALAAWLEAGGVRVVRDRRAFYASAAAVIALLTIVAGIGMLTLVGRLEGSDGAHRALNATRGFFGPLLLVVALGVLFGAKGLHDFFSLRPLRSLSIVSYNAYLWNLEIAVVLQILGLPAPAIFFGGAVVTLLVAGIVTYGFERPILRDGLPGLAIAAAAARARVRQFSAQFGRAPAVPTYALERRDIP